MRLEFNVSGLDAVKRELKRIGDDVGRGQAAAAAINKVAGKAQVEIRRAVTERYALPADLVRGSLSVHKAGTLGRGNIGAVIDVFGSPTKRGRSMNMIRFLAALQAAGRAHQTRGKKVAAKQLTALGQQLGFRIMKGGALKTITGAFIANKGRTVFQRTGAGRLPIEPVQVIGVSQMFNSKWIRSRVMAKIHADLALEMRRAVDMILARRAA